MDQRLHLRPSPPMAMPAISTPTSRTRLADPALRRAVEAAVRRRVRGDEAEDVVQATFTDVLSASQLPEDDEELRRFVFGVARNKVFDHFRRQKRQAQQLDDDDAEGGEQPLSARDMLRWAEGELSDSEARATLEWMLREGDGEKLEQIARDARVPAPRVRKRVSRLRKLLRERWAAELMLAGVGLLLLLAGALYYFEFGRNPDDVVKREPPRPLPSAPIAPFPRALPSALPTEPESRPALETAPAPSAIPSATPPRSKSNAKPPAPRPVSSSPPRKSQLTTELDAEPQRGNVPAQQKTSEPLPRFDAK